MEITCGIDWAEAHHDVALVDRDGQRIARQRIDTGVTGFGDLMGASGARRSMVPVERLAGAH